MMVANLICCTCMGTIRVNLVKQGLGINYVDILVDPPKLSPLMWQYFHGHHGPCSRLPSRNQLLAVGAICISN